MKFIISCVESAKVELPELNECREIWKWLLVYVWFSVDDTKINENDIKKIVSKIVNTKFLFNNEAWKIWLSVKDIKWEVLLISNFTLYWRIKKWTKIDFMLSGKFEYSKKNYDKLVSELWKCINLKTWEFWKHMIVSSKNKWPLNYVLDF